jgi:NitT/TauT family transport system permease protein
MSQLRIVAWRTALLLALLMAWEAATGGWLGTNSELAIFFSSPVKIILALIENWPQLLSDTLVTVTEAFLGLILGIVTGVTTAILFTRFRTLDLVVEPILQALNAIPRPALAPLLIIWFGLGIESKIAVAWSVVFFIMFYNVYAGVKAIDPDYIRSIRILGATPRQVVRIVIAPAILTWVFAAFRICVAYSLLGAVVGEFAGATAGLGYRLIVAEGLLETDLLYAIILILMVVGYSAAILAKWVEGRLLRWRPPAATM